MKKAVICFTRVPRAGLTKTRLMGLLSGEQCAQLHWAFLRDLSVVYENLDVDFLSFIPQIPTGAPSKLYSPRRRSFTPRPARDWAKR